MEREIKENNLQDFFSDVNGSVHDKTEVVSEIMQKNNFKPAETIYVGDMVHDIETGIKAGIITVIVACGYQSKKVLLEKNPDFLIENLEELKKIILKK